jgi:hypothetical protein
MPQLAACCMRDLLATSESNFCGPQPEIARLIQAAESVLDTEKRCTVPLTIIRRRVA